MNCFTRELYKLTLKNFTPVTIIRSCALRIKAIPSSDFQRISLTFPYQPSRNAGHSKWANIKHTKAAKDEERSKDTSKFVTMIKSAVREGGSADPKVNSKLAQVMTQIKDAKLPMASFDKALLSLQVRKDEKSFMVPIRGPGNCILLAEFSTDKVQGCKQDINTILRKNKAIIVDESVLYLFNHKGVIYSTGLEGKSASEQELEKVIEDAIEAGADDVTFQKEHPEFGSVYEFITEPNEFHKVKHALEKKKYDVIYGDVDYIPVKPVELEESDINDAHKLYQKLSEHPDARKISTNIA